MVSNRTLGGTLAAILAAAYLYYTIWILSVPWIVSDSLMMPVFEVISMYWALAVPALFITALFGLLGVTCGVEMMRGK